jgi:hypothetical protein
MCLDANYILGSKPSEKDFTLSYSNKIVGLSALNIVHYLCVYSLFTLLFIFLVNWQCLLKAASQV